MREIMPANADDSPVAGSCAKSFTSKRDKIVQPLTRTPVTAGGLDAPPPHSTLTNEKHMLTDTLFRQPRQSGVQLLQKRGDGGARELSTRRLRLDAGTSATFRLADEETVVVLQQGSGTFAAAGNTWPVSRSGVFTERATALYLPPGVELTATADTLLEAVLISTPAPSGGTATLIGPDDVRVNARGRANYSREVHDIFVTDPHVKRLMVGETFNPPRQLEQLPAAQARRQGRRADARRGLLLHDRPAAGLRPADPLHERRRVGQPLGPRRRRGAAAVRLSPRVGDARLSPLLPLGHGRRTAKARAARGSRAQVDPRGEALTRFANLPRRHHEGREAREDREEPMGKMCFAIFGAS